MNEKQPIWTKSFISLFMTNATVFVVFYSLISTLPLYAKDVLFRTDDEAGLLITIFLLSAIFSRPFSGKILDLFGKRKMLLISLAFYLICTILYAFVHSFIGLLSIRFIQGIWFSIATTASGSLAADHIPIKRRGAGLGYYAMSTNVAVIFGPMIGLFVIQSFSFEALFYTLSALMVVGSMIALSIPADQVSTRTEKSFTLSFDDLFERKAIPISFVACLFAFSYASVLSYLSIYAQQKELLSFASSFFLVFAVTMITTRPFTGRFFDEKGPSFVIIPALISYIIGLLFLASMGSVFVFMLSGVFFGLGYGAAVPSLQTLAIQSTSRDRSGYATATFFTFFDTGIAIGSYVLGMIAIALNYESMYIISAAVIIFVLLFYLKVKPKQQS